MFKDLGMDVLNRLSFNEIEVLKYIEKNKNRVLNMSIQELSKEVYVSTATIMRLCKKMGFSGFSELKHVIKEKITNDSLPKNKITSIDDVIEDNLFDIKQTKRMLDDQNISNAIGLLMSDKSIHLYSRGITVLCIEYMNRVLLSMNRKSTMYVDQPVMYSAALQMTSEDVLFIASASGATKEIIKVAQIAKSNGATVIAISNFDNNPLSQVADVNFYAMLAKRKFAGLDVKSRLPIFFVISVILECFIKEKETKALSRQDEVD
jgi:DNA-binding MurR/RpiR family transcriptional regulator